MVNMSLFVSQGMLMNKFDNCWLNLGFNWQFFTTLDASKPKNSKPAIMLDSFKLICIILLLTTIGCEQQKEVFSPEFKENINARVDNGINCGIVIGMVTPEGTSFYSYGTLSTKTNEPVNEHTVFEIGSISKTFTGILLAQEVIHGELRLDDPLQQFLPEGITAPSRNGEQIKLVNLANHTSALPSLVDNYERKNPENPFVDISIQNTYDFINTYELPYDIGSKFAYSNLAMGLLGNVLAEKNNTDYEGLMVEQIAGPLGMGDTRITLTAAMKKRMAQGHRLGVEVDPWELPALAGAGAIRSTAEDMTKYLAANMGIMETELYPAMELSHQYSGSEMDIYRLGLGWISMTIDSLEIVWHSGSTGGYMSFAGFVKGGERGVVVLTNSNVMPDDIGIHLLNPKSPLAIPKPSLANKLLEVIENKGVEAAQKTYAEVMEQQPETYSINEHEFNKLAFRYKGYKKIPEALAVLEITVDAFPESWMSYDTYAEVLLENNEKEKAIEYFKKSLAFNPENYNAIENLEKLGVVNKETEQ